MIHPSVEDLQKAIDNAEYDAMDFFSMLRESTLLVPANEHINARDAMYIQRSIAYVVLGLTSITESVDDILTTLEGEEFDILSYIKSVFALAPSELTAQIKKYPINLASEAEDRLLIGDTDAELGINSAQVTTTDKTLINTSTDASLSRESVLHEIEHPHETVKTPEYVFPKTKPTTSDTLRTLTQTDSDTVSIIDPFKKAPIVDTAEPTIFDPFKQTPSPSSPVSSSVPPQTSPATPPPAQPSTSPLATPNQSVISGPLQYIPPVTPPSPASVIRDNLNKKLSSVTGIGAKESFKTHDPYREPIEK